MGGYTPQALRELYPYQKRYLEDMPRKGIMSASLGTGKSLMAAYHYKTHAAPQPLLIIAPASKTRSGDWEKELEHAGYDLSLLDYRIISRERFVMGKTKEGPMWQQFSPAHNGGKQYAVIVDEIHLGGRNGTGSFVRKLKPVVNHASFFIGLTATPLPNGWQDAIGYAVLFDFVKNVTAFRNRYLNIVRYKGFPEIKGYYHEDELEKWWGTLAKPLSRAEANELPPRQFVPVDFNEPLVHTQAVRTRMIDEEMLDSPPKLFHGLRQLLNGAKLDTLESIVEGTNENVLVWYNYDSEREAILERLRKLKDKTVYEVTGHAHTSPDRIEWAELESTVTLCQYKSASAGIELTYATVSVYYSPTYSYAEYSQSLGRNYREGQTEKVLVYNFRTLDTVEVEIYNALRDKKSFTEKVITLWAKELDN